MSSNRTAQYLMEDIYNRKTIYKMVAKDIEDSKLGLAASVAMAHINQYMAKTYYESKNLRIKQLEKMETEDIFKEVIVAVMLSTEPQPIQSVAARLAANLPFDSHLDAAKTASELIAVVCYSDIYDIIPARNSETGTLMVQSRYSLEEKTLKAIEATKYLPPMVCEPNEITGLGNIDNSHVSFEDSLILGKDHHHHQKLAIDAINIANQVALTLDTAVLEQAEMPNKELDTPEKMKQFKKLADDSREVYEEIVALGNEFYLTWKFDFRGRMYSQGYHINIQSTEYKKALINLAHKEVISCEL